MEYQNHELKHAERIRKMAAECTLFLKRDDSFPLCKPCPLYAVGNGVRYTVKGGTGGGEVNSHFYINVEEGLRNSGFTLTSTVWLDAYDELKHLQEEELDRKIRENLKKSMRVYGLFVETGKHDPELDVEIPMELSGESHFNSLNFTNCCKTGFACAASSPVLSITSSRVRLSSIPLNTIRTTV